MTWSNGRHPFGWCEGCGVHFKSLNDRQEGEICAHGFILCRMCKAAMDKADFEIKGRKERVEIEAQRTKLAKLERRAAER